MKQILSYGILVLMFITILVGYDWYQEQHRPEQVSHVTFVNEVDQTNTIDFIVVESNSSFEFDQEFFGSNPQYLTVKQYSILRRAMQFGEPYDLELTMMAIALQESSAGRFGPVGDIGNGFGRRSYGVMQVKKQTAKHVIDYYDMTMPKTDEELIARLIYDEDYNMTIALHYLLLLRESGMGWRELVTAYNQGPGGARLVNPENFYYTERIAEMVQSGIPVRIREISAKSE